MLALCHEQIWVTLVQGSWYFGDRYDYYIRYPYLLEEFRKLFSDGIWYPRWLTRMYGGYGYPVFVMYPAGYWFFSLPFTYLMSAADKAATLSNVVHVTLAFTAYYKIARLLGNERMMAIALVALVALDRLWANGAAYYCIGLSSRFAYGFALWGIYFLLQCYRKLVSGEHAFRYAAGWVVASAAVFYTHPHESLLYAVMNGLLVLGMLLEKQSRGYRMRMAAVAALAGTAALALSAPYWFTAWYFTDKVALQAAFHSGYVPWVILARQGGMGFFFHHAYPRFVEVVFYAVMLLCMVSLRHQRRMWPLFAIYPLLLFMQLPQSIPWWHLPILRNLMSPMRLESLLVSVEFLVIAAACANLRALQRLPVSTLLALLFAGILFITHSDYGRYWLPPLKVRYDVRHTRLERSQFLSFQGWDEFRPRTARIAGHPNRHLHGAISHFQWIGAMPEGVYSNDRYDGRPLLANVQMGKVDGPYEVRINQLYLPGWVVEVDDRVIPFTARRQDAPKALPYMTMDEQGRMLVRMDNTGRYTLKAYYEGPPYWLWRNLASLLVLLIAFPLLRRLTKPAA